MGCACWCPVFFPYVQYRQQCNIMTSDLKCNKHFSFLAFYHNKNKSINPQSSPGKICRRWVEDRYIHALLHTPKSVLALSDNVLAMSLSTTLILYQPHETKNVIGLYSKVVYLQSFLMFAHIEQFVAKFITGVEN